MKVGDKVVCIKNYTSSHYPDIKYYKGMIYVISEIWEITGDTIYTVEYEKNNNTGMSFYKRDFRLLIDYFITLNDSRKQKLNKINESTLY